MDNQVRIKLLVLDLDGTVLRSDGSLSGELVKAVNQVKAHGITVILATGRMVRSAEPYWLQLQLGTGPLIAYNGSMVVEMPRQVPWFSWHLTEDVARFVIEEALDADILTQVYVGNELWLSKEDERAQHYIEVNHIPGDVKSREGLLSWPSPPIKILLQDDPEKLDQFRLRISPEVLGLQGRIFKSQADYLEIVPAGVGKGPALAKVAERLHLSPQHIMAIGDAENDVDMLKWVGMGVAMGQAPELVKHAADVVTKSVDQDGAAYAIYRWLLDPMQGFHEMQY
ncbi:MAG: Cof-type HAD-IIB family hydrolase [Sulfobacillus thermosulfidooxidans]|uniref:Cof-type HAD-IIB family hydrolase n=1 Tax=Sulfobacillus thermosulfidooxidans TaxID=28034 RepID=A0A2T2WYD9_SULTH|nr:MAG: Cof-type HAD-IIB family hydrolase [Sulfobacillus thermosulfidooxidans]